MQNQIQFRNVTELRAAFWATGMFTPNVNRNGKPLPQNEQYTDCRCAFVDYVDALSKDGAISEQLAQRATL